MDFGDIMNIEREIVQDFNQLASSLVIGFTDNSPRSRHRGGHHHHHHVSAEEQARIDREAARQIELKKLELQQQQLERQREAQRELDQYIDKKSKCARHAMGDGNYREAIEHFTGILNRVPDHIEANTGIKQAHRKIADKSYSARNYFEAIEHYKAANEDVAAVLKTWVHELELEENEADQIPLTRCHSALTQYQAISIQLDQLETIAQGPKISKLQAKVPNKMALLKKEVRSMEAKSKAEAADRAVEKIVNTNLIQLDKEGSIHFKNQLTEINKRYKAARDLDPNIAPAQEGTLKILEMNIAERIKQWRIHELGDSLMQRQKLLLNYSLKRHVDLEHIIECCTEWGKNYDELLKDFPAGPPGALNRNNMNEVLNQALEAQRRDQSIAGNLCEDIVELALSEWGQFKRLTEPEYGVIRDELRNAIATSPLSRDRLAGLTAPAFGKFKKHLKDYYAPYLVQKSVIMHCICGGPLSYELLPHQPLSYNRMDAWLNTICEGKNVEWPDIPQILNLQPVILGGPPA